MLDWDGSPRLLLVESHEGLRRDLTRALESLGYRVDAHAARSDIGGVASRPRYDVHVFDVATLDEGSTEEALEFDEARTVWISSASLAEPLEAVTPARKNRVLLKPFSIRALERSIADCLHADSSAHASIGDPILATAEPSFAALLDRARQVARQDAAVVIEGELGSGRRALAAAIHRWSPRQGANCVAVDRADLECDGPGRAADCLRSTFERASGGSVLIVEPADWPDWAQRALTAALRRDGDDPRLLTVTRESLERCVREGRLILELQYRLDAACFQVPSLRDRPLDQLALCVALARRVARSLGRITPTIDEALVDRLARDGFPGNLIGLESRLRSALIRSDASAERIDGALDGSNPTARCDAEQTASLDLKALERDTIVRALAHWRGNRTRASESLGISVRTLRNKIRDLGLR